MNKTTEKIPTWSLCYLINGDATGLTDEEIEMVNKWCCEWCIQAISPNTDKDGEPHPYFSPSPLFGYPCEVEDCDLTFINEN